MPYHQATASISGNPLMQGDQSVDDYPVKACRKDMGFCEGGSIADIYRIEYDYISGKSFSEYAAILLIEPEG